MAAEWKLNRHARPVNSCILLRRLDRVLVRQRLFDPLDHFLRADLPEALPPAVPVAQDGLGPFASRGLLVRLNQRQETTLPIGAVEPLPYDALTIGLLLEIAIRVEHKGHSAGHAGAEIAADWPQDHRIATGHIFAAIGAAALDHDIRSAIAHSEPFARLSGRKQLPGSCAIEHRVTDDCILLAVKWGADHRADGDLATAQTLADIIIGITKDLQRDTLAEKGAERLSGRPRATGYGHGPR